MRKKLWFIFILSLLGIAASAYAVHLHYSVDASSFCNFSGTFNCDIVNKSWASEIIGIPVATIGLVGYALLALGSLWLICTQKLRTATWGAMALASLGGLGFAFFLTGVEIFSLHTLCIVCVASQLIILALTMLVWRFPEARQGVRSWFFSSAS
ncbi:MAG: vitamin K epoxide reductase family protein [Patescibacteria group bacterium]